MTTQSTETAISTAISRYAIALQTVEQARHPLPVDVILEVLLARDAVQLAVEQAQTTDQPPTKAQLAELIALDDRLKGQTAAFCQNDQLTKCRNSLNLVNPPWWWCLEPRPDTPQSFNSKFDWIWNLGTVACLVVATSFMTQTIQAFSNQGFDFLGTLSTIGQGAGLAFVAGGALTDKGKKAVADTLTTVRIPASLHAEATFAASLVFLGGTYGLYNNLPKVGEWYFSQGQQHEQNQEWSQAFSAYQRALDFSPDDEKIRISIGFLYENLGNFEQAIKEYKKGAEFGTAEFLNAQGRAMVMGVLQKNNWQGGVDEQVLRDADNLFQRAKVSTTDWSRKGGDAVINPHLWMDIEINRAIVQLAQIKSTKTLNQTLQAEFESPIQTLLALSNQLTKSKTKPAPLLTKISTLGDNRIKCYIEHAYRRGATLDLPSMDGIDVFANTTFYDCAPIFWGKSKINDNDRAFLRSYQFPGDGQGGYANNPNVRFVETIYGFGSNTTRLIQQPQRWVELANNLSTLIKNTFAYDWPPKQQIVWRVILNQNGQIIAYFAYDEVSREIGNAQSFITEARAQKRLEAWLKQATPNQPGEFADFKVVLSAEGKVLQILPWSAAYPAWNQRCQQDCKNIFLSTSVKSAFASYTPNLKDPAELAALRGVLYSYTAPLGIDPQHGIFYPEPSVFKLKVSSDGQIVSYAASNQIATEKFGDKFPFSPLKDYQYPELQKTPYADFKLEVTGLAYRITPWGDGM